MGKEYSTNLHSIKNTGNNLTLKQMCDISEKLIVGHADEIYGVTPIFMETMIFDDEEVSSSLAR